MDVGQALLVALFTITVVFCVLALVYLLIRLVSLAMGWVSGAINPAVVSVRPADTEPSAPTLPAVSTGTLRLRDVDEPTAALIMAIISDESGIPLSELCFRSIRLLPESADNTRQEESRA